jgi:hypothetical protein
VTVRDDIIAGTRATLTAIGGGVTWQHVARTSEPDAEVDAFAAPAAVTPVHLVRRQVTSEYDEQRRAYIQREVASIRVSSAVTMRIGDRVTDPDGNSWAVNGPDGSGIGTIRYLISRDLPLLGGADRGGI